MLNGGEWGDIFHQSAYKIGQFDLLRSSDFLNTDLVGDEQRYERLKEYDRQYDMDNAIKSFELIEAMTPQLREITTISSIYLHYITSPVQ